MPRRKKTGKDLPPLEFVESPLYQYAPFRQFRVFESANNAMARLVPVDELENIPWVSPQFRNRQGTHISRSRKAAKTFTKLRSRSEGSLAECPHSGVKSKYPPLQFFQQTRALKSPNLKHAQRNSIKTSKELTSSRTNSPANSVRIRDHGQSNSEMFPENSFTLNTPPNQVSTHDHIDLPEIQGCEYTSLDDNAGIDGNDQRDKYSQSSASQHVSRKTRTCVGGESEAITIASSHDEVCNNCGFQLKKSDIIRVCDSRDVSFCQCVQCLDGVDMHQSASADEDANSDPSRKWIFCTPPRLSHPRCVKVLAADTPERDYGLGMRQRQLKYLFDNVKERR